MTIPSGASPNWCSSCEEECNDHPSVCTVCGTGLQYAPERRATAAAARQPTTGRQSNGHALLMQLQGIQRQQPSPSARIAALLGDNIDPELANLLQNLQNHSSLMQRVLMQGGSGTEWESVPAELLDPHAGMPQSSSSRPTSNEYLKSITKLTLRENSSLFYKASVSIPLIMTGDDKKKLTMDAIPADFGRLTNITPDDKSNTNGSSCLILADPKTGKGGRLSQATLDQVQSANNTVDLIMYMERGGDVSFVQKARLAQAAGAKALIIGNNQAAPWPYVMKDTSSSSENDEPPVTIPVVMVRQADGQAILGAFGKQSASIIHAVSFSLERTDNHDCIICQEAYEQGTIAVRIPACGHVFHEACAMMWLTKHNTCPFCRRELPTDDADYEQERRRQQRTHAGSQGVANTQYEDFYG